MIEWHPGFQSPPPTKCPEQSGLSLCDNTACLCSIWLSWRSRNSLIRKRDARPLDSHSPIYPAPCIIVGYGNHLSRRRLAYVCGHLVGVHVSDKRADGVSIPTQAARTRFSALPQHRPILRFRIIGKLTVNRHPTHYNQLCRGSIRRVDARFAPGYAQSGQTIP